MYSVCVYICIFIVLHYGKTSLFTSIIPLETKVRQNIHTFRIIERSQVWRLMPLIPGLRRPKKSYLCDFKSSLVYKATYMTNRTVIQRISVFIKQER